MTHPMLEFLNRCLDADEKVAQAALEAWRRSVRRRGAQWPKRTDINEEDAALLAFHNAHHSPAAVLADIASKRAVLAIHVPFDPVVKPDGSTTWLCGGCSADDGYWHVAFPCPTVRALVSAFAAREGYSADWGPT